MFYPNPNMLEPSDWIRQPQECEGDYFFDGKFLASRRIVDELYIEDILDIVDQVKNAVEKEIGIDFLQVFKNSQGEKIFCIDQLSKSMKEQDYTPEEVKKFDFWTMMFAEEY